MAGRKKSSGCANSIYYGECFHLWYAFKELFFGPGHTAVFKNCFKNTCDVAEHQNRFIMVACFILALRRERKKRKIIQERPWNSDDKIESFSKTSYAYQRHGFAKCKKENTKVNVPKWGKVEEVFQVKKALFTKHKSRTRRSIRKVYKSLIKFTEKRMQQWLEKQRANP